MHKVDTDTATILSLWAGIGGLAIGFAGIGLTLYSFFRESPSEIVLTASGWIAALGFALTFGYVGKQFVRLDASLSERVAELQALLAEQTAANTRLIEIDAYVISSRGRIKNAPRPSTHEPNKEIDDAD